MFLILNIFLVILWDFVLFSYIIKGEMFFGVIVLNFFCGLVIIFVNIVLVMWVCVVGVIVLMVMLYCFILVVLMSVSVVILVLVVL